MDMGDANKVVGILAVGSVVGLLGCAVLAFFVAPHYAQAVDTAMGAFKDGFLFAVGAKAGLAIPRQS